MMSSTSLLERGAPLRLDRAGAEALTGGRWIGHAASATIHGASIDSRRIWQGCLFACLSGARADGHDFAATAVGDGAALILASRPVAVPVPVLVVADVAAALGAIAAEFRRRCDPACTWIGIGGANGKTTSKELVAAALAGALGPSRVHATRGNLNNHLGVPLSVLATPAGCRAAVIEIGANHPGEVAALAAIVRPQIGLVTSIGPEHLEGFGTLEGVAAAECELFAALPPGAPAILGLAGVERHCADHRTTPERILAIAERAAAGRSLRVIRAGDGAVEADGISLMADGAPVRLRLLGAHNLANATAALAVAAAAGVPPAVAAAAMAQVRPVAGRLVVKHHGEHRILDDTYNANPASMLAALDVLAGQPGERLAILGAMGELGAEHAAGHAQVGAAAARLGLPLIAVGAGAAAMAEAYRAGGGPWLHAAADAAAAVAAARARIAGGGPHAVLVKASRSSALERVVAGLLEDAC